MCRKINNAVSLDIATCSEGDKTIDSRDRYDSIASVRVVSNFHVHII